MVVRKKFKRFIFLYFLWYIALSLRISYCLTLKFFSLLDSVFSTNNLILYFNLSIFPIFCAFLYLELASYFMLYQLGSLVISWTDYYLLLLGYFIVFFLFSLLLSESELFESLIALSPNLFLFIFMSNYSGSFNSVIFSLNFITSASYMSSDKILLLY